MSVRTGGGGLASSQKCKILDFGHILEKGKTVSGPVALPFSARKPWVLRLHHQSWHQTVPSPPSQTVGSSWGEANGEMGIQDSTGLVSERCGPFSWLQPGYRSGLKKISFFTPSVVPTQCIKRGLQPLRQTRWHLSQVQNLFLELFVVKLQSALELSTQSLPAHKCPPIARPVWLTGMWSFFSRNNPERADQVQGPLLVCRRLSRQMWCGPVPWFAYGTVRDYIKTTASCG